MLPIKIDISSAIDNFALTESQSANLANLITANLANSYANNMIALAKDRLHSTRREFINGIKVSEISKYKSMVEIIGVVPNMVTMGASPFDMKDGFSKSANKKSKKGGGWYLTISFRHANPNAVASSSIFSSVMPQAVYNVAKLLTSGGKGLSVSQLPVGYNTANSRPAIETAAGAMSTYEHNSPKFAGLTKSGSGNNTQYNTFRRVSDKSDANSWIHSGIVAKNIHTDAMKMMNVVSESKMIIDKFLDSI